MKALCKIGRGIICFWLSMTIVLTTAMAVDINSYYGTPYGGNPIRIGKETSVLRFCDYDIGPEGIAFKEMDANNTSTYRPGAVDLYQFGTTLVTLSGLAEGEWVNYTVRIEETGYYDFDLGSTLNVSYLPDCVIHFELDGKDITGPITVSRTDSKVDVPRQVIKNILLREGVHVFTMAVEQGTGNLSDIVFTWSEVQADLNLKSVGFNKSAITLEQGDAELLRVIVEPRGFDADEVIWKCDNEAVVRIGNNGAAEALSCGIASVEASMGGMTAKCKINVVPAASQLPYKKFKLEQNVFVPCIDYNIGGNGVAFFKDGSRRSTLYRREEVIIEGEPGNYYVCDTRPGEWIKYSFTAEKTDLFNVGVLCNTEEGGGHFSLMLDNELIIDGASVLQGAAWDDFSSVEAREIEIEEGEHTFKLLFEEAGGMYKGISVQRARTLDDLKFDEQYEGTPYESKAFPIGIEAAVLPLWRFDEGGNGVAYSSAVGKRSEGATNYKVRLYEDVHLFNYDDGIVALTGNNAGEWLNYTIDVNKNGYYDVSIVTSWTDEWSHEGSMHLELDGVPITEEKIMPVTGNWNNWTEVNLGNMYLPKGKHILKLVLDTGGSVYTELKFSYTGDDTVTRGEFAHALSRELLPAVDFEENFRDVPKEAPYYNAVGALKKMGIIRGGEDGLFNPDAPVTKEQAIHIITELLLAENRLNPNRELTVLDAYSDADAVSSWAKESAAIMANAGLTLGAQNKISGSEAMTVSTVANFIDFAGRCVAVNKEIPQIEPEYLSEELAPAYDWIKKDLLRGMYGHPYDVDQQAELVTENIEAWGLNTMFIHVMYRENETPEGFRAFAKRVKASQDKLGIKFMFSTPYGSSDVYGNTQFGGMATGSEFHKWRTPCPLSQGYWDAVVGDRAVIAAEEGVAGLIVDMEMYGADSAMHGGPCYCDSCWSRFMSEYSSMKNPLAVPETERAGAVAQSGIAVDYTRWQEIAVEDLLSGIEQRVHNVNPDFILGNMLYFESLPGLARGFGTPTKPALVLSEAEYSGGISAVPDRVQAIKTQGYPALFISGFWPNPIKAPDLYDKITQGAPLGSGYWLYWAQSFKYENPDHHPDYTTDEYIESLTKANTKLDAILESGEYIDVTAEIAAPTYTALKVEGAPTEADWAKVPYTVDFRLYTTGTVEPTSRAKILWNGRKLFVRVYNDEPQMATLPDFDAERDRPSLWMEDCNELFWKFSEDDSFVHFVAGRQGCYWDSYGKGAAVENAAMNYNAEVSVQNKSDSWVLDFNFDLTIDGERYAQSGDVIGLEICRHRSLDSVDSCWAPTFGGYKHAMNLWGQVTLE